MTQLKTEIFKEIATEKKTHKTPDKRKAFVRKGTSTTFWNQLRIKNNYSLQDLSEVLECKIPYLSACFTGKDMPSRAFSDKVSELFGVPNEEGWKQFKSGYEVWHNVHNKTITKGAVKINPPIEEAVNKYINEPEEKVSVVEETKTVCKADRSHDDLLKVLFGAMLDTDFIELVHTIDEGTVDWGLVMGQLYGTIPMDTFIELIKLRG